MAETITTPGLITSFDNTPQANADAYSYTEAQLEADTDGIIWLDVMSNDLGGKAKTLYSITAGSDTDGDGDIDTSDLSSLLTKDVAGVEELSALGAKISIRLDPADGKVKIAYDPGTLFDTLDDGETKTDTFRYAIRLANGALSWDVVTFTVTGANDAPTAVDDKRTVNEDETLNAASVLGNDTDPDVEDLDVAAVKVGATTITDGSAGDLDGSANGSIKFATEAGGTVTLDTETGTFSYEQNGVFNGLDDGETSAESFQYKVTDGTAESGFATVNLTINGVNDAPVVDSASLTLNEGQTVTLSGANFGITDPDDTSFTYTVSLVSGGFFQLSSAPGLPITSFSSADLAGNLVQFVDDGDEVAPSFNVKINDGDADSNTLAATINYTPLNDVPVMDSASLTLNEGQTVTLSGANFGITDPDDTSFTYTVSLVSGGFFQLSSAPGMPITSFSSADLAGNLVQFVDDGDEVAPSFSVKISDGDADSNTLAATINYTPVNDAPVISVDGAVSYTTGGPAVKIDDSITITDVDSATLKTATLSISGGSFRAGDSLNFVDQLGITGSYDGLTGILTLTGAPSSFANFDTAIESITFSTTSTDTTTRTISYLVNDGAANSATDTASVSIVLGVDPNDNNNDNQAVNTVADSGDKNANTLHGTTGADNIDGGGANDTIYGGADNDTLNGNNDNDTIYGGSGNDTIDGGGGLDLIFGGSGNDQITGQTDSDTVYGGSGSDTINGGGGTAADVLIGGLAADTLTGAGGADTFRYLSTLDAGDVITDFEAAATDKIEFSQAWFTSLSLGTLGAANFVSGAGATALDGNDFIVFDTTDGHLYYDSDGNGGNAPILIASITVVSGTVDNTDFTVIA